jgi:Ser/Thr protein kinase RdoA (MazF antagonist)
LLDQTWGTVNHFYFERLALFLLSFKVASLIEVSVKFLSNPVDTQLWIHADLAHKNLISAVDHLSAAIDFGELGIGNCATDLIVAWNL